MSERIQKIISASGYCSRRAAEKLIKQGRVTVNGRTATLGESAELTDNITINNRPLPQIGKRTYIMLNKPRGYVCTMSDEKGRDTVADLVKTVPARVVPVGRLDYDSEGLLIMTDDGDLTLRLTHPSHLVEKSYLVRVAGKITDDKIRALRELRQIDDEAIRPAEVMLMNSSEESTLLSMTITEGKNRQIRRMCDSVGLSVVRLKRITEGSLKLGSLQSGQWRYLTDDEVNNLQK